MYYRIKFGIGIGWDELYNDNIKMTMYKRDDHHSHRRWLISMSPPIIQPIFVLVLLFLAISEIYSSTTTTTTTTTTSTSITNGTLSNSSSVTNTTSTNAPTNDLPKSSSSSSSSSSNLNIATTVRLNDGNTIPMLGIGVCLMGENTYQAIQWALAAGYQLIDTAAEDSYGNEDQVGNIVRDFYYHRRHRSYNNHHHHHHYDNNNNNNNNNEKDENGLIVITHDDGNNSSNNNNDDNDNDNDNVNDNDNDNDHVYVTTKLWDSDHGFYATLNAFDESYRTLNIGTIDLYT